jgi:CHAT domain-containing protein/tetratricopeptide (TPR) repeat protein
MRQVLTIVALSVTFANGARAAAPPASRTFTGEEQRQIAALEKRVDEQVAKEAFEEVERLTRQVLTLRQRVQGKRHWQSVDARWAVERWQRLARVPAPRRRDVVESLAFALQGRALRAEGRYREAEQAARDALMSCKKALGDEHPETARSANLLAVILSAQSKNARALPLLENALAVCKKVLGEEHPDTANVCNNLAASLNARAEYARAQTLYEQGLAIRRKVLGESHPDTARSYNNVAFNLNAQGKYAPAQPLYEKALAIRKQALGEGHPDVAQSCNNVGMNLDAQGRYAEARRWFEQALAICKSVLGEDHPHTALASNNLGSNLMSLGEYAQALPLLEKALAIRRNVLGDEHPLTASSYNNVANCLDRLAKYARAQPLYEKALAICRNVLGEEHPETARIYDNFATNLQYQGKYSQALPLHEKALAIRRQVLGEEHTETALSYLNLAGNLRVQGKQARVQPLLEKALAINQKVLGEEHLLTASSYNSLGWWLMAQGNSAQARPLFEKALRIRQKAAGPEHPDTIFGRNNLGWCLTVQGEYAQARQLVEQALATCLKALGADHPEASIAHSNLALLSWKLGEREKALQHLQAACRSHAVARADRAGTGFERSLSEGSEPTPELLLAAVLASEGKAVDAFRHAEASLARGLLDSLGTAPGIPKQDRLAQQTRLGQLDALLVPLLGRSDLGAPQQERRDMLLKERTTLLARLSRQTAEASERLVLPLKRIQAQVPPDTALVLWVDAFEMGEHWACVLRAKGPPAWQRLPGTGPAKVWTREDMHLASRLQLLLSDPLSTAAQRQRLIEALRRQRLEPLRPHLKGRWKLLIVPTWPMEALPVEVLSDDYQISYIPSASVFARAMERQRPQRDATLLAVGDPVFIPARPSALVRRGTGHEPLPGTRQEVRALARLVPDTTLLLGSQASEQNLTQLAASGKLKSFRLLHFATHGEVNAFDPRRSALILSQDRLPSRPAAAVLSGEKPLDGRLTVDTILGQWELDAQLVVLSACQTGLGKESGGEGMLGFAQALLQKGARSVLLSRWKVDDNVTAILIVRFYENLLGKREGLKAPLSKAEALREAKDWLRTLTREETEKRLTKLVDGVPRSERGSIGKPLPPRKPEAGKADRPFAHPYYWAAFVLIGDPR